ncbi:MAG: MoaD/ThiS family protein [Thermoplasmata archaeon]|nr:MoaD/ThiS family protein [Thermoplasmata archaeon]
MEIEVTLLPQNIARKQEIPPMATIEDLIKIMRLKPDTVIAMRDNTPIPIDETIKEGDKITIIKVSSGG